jgi:opacity protein-like surface antigen
MLRKLIITAVGAALLASPAKAADMQYRPGEVRSGAFVGLRLHLPFTGRKTGEVRAALAIAPTQGRVLNDGYIQTRFGEGLSLKLAPGARPALTLAGVRMDTVLGVNSGPEVQTNQRLGLSGSGWLIVGGVLVAAAVGFAVLYDEARDNTE